MPLGRPMRSFALLELPCVVITYGNIRKNRKNCNSCSSQVSWSAEKSSLNVNHVFPFCAVCSVYPRLSLNSDLSVVFLSRGSCQMFPHITCLKSLNGLVVFVRKLEVVHKQVRSCLISYNLQLACVRKLEVI